ncbi:MAG: HAMP domain-containing sensor histidine kinase [Bacteroidota bacterium]
MLLKNFRFNVIVRVVIITSLSLTLSLILHRTQWFFTPLVVGILTLLAVINLIYYVEKTNKDITQFLLSIKQGGFTNVFKGKQRGMSYAGLSGAFNDVINEFQRISIEKESQYQYLQALNENIGVSIISYNQDTGRIEFLNPAAKKLLFKPNLLKIDDVGLIDQNLLESIKTLYSGERQVIKVVLNREVVQLSIQVKDFVLQENHFRLVLLQNINSELEQKEVEAWQKLISVLTHEIMNSVTPIVSLSTAINAMMVDHDSQALEEDKEDIMLSLQTIENRSKGLMRFVNAYKDFSKTPELKLTEFDLFAMIRRITHLLAPDMNKKGIKLELDLKGRELLVKADNELIEQILINLLKNAIEVLSAEGHIHLSARRGSHQKVEVIVEDNGPGIAPEVLDKIFIPFFTTKQKGTGIGLSFARQVMKLHQGSISVNSELNKGTRFELEF